MSWNIQKPGDYINGPLTVVGVAQFNSNIGIGIAPTTFSSGKTLEAGFKGNAFWGFTQENTFITSNAYFNGGWKYGGTGKAATYALTQGGHSWSVSNTVGSADSAITTFLTAMTLDSIGNLGLGNAPVSNFRLTSIGGFASGLGGAYIETGEFNRYGLVINNSNASAATNLVEIRKASVALAAFTAAGNLAFGNTLGIDFSASGNNAGATSELLNDYEEGTWTGTLKGTTADPTTAVTATGRYTKVGRVVSLQIHFDNVNTTGASGVIYVLGAPFTNGGLSTFGTAASGVGATFTGTLTSYIGNAQTNLFFVGVNSNASTSDATHNAGSGRYFWLNTTYIV